MVNGTEFEIENFPENQTFFINGKLTHHVVGKIYRMYEEKFINTKNEEVINNKIVLMVQNAEFVQLLDLHIGAYLLSIYNNHQPLVVGDQVGVSISVTANSGFSTKTNKDYHFMRFNVARIIRFNTPATTLNVRELPDPKTIFDVKPVDEGSFILFMNTFMLNLEEYIIKTKSECEGELFMSNQEYEKFESLKDLVINTFREAFSSKNVKEERRIEAERQAERDNYDYDDLPF